MHNVAVQSYMYPYTQPSQLVPVMLSKGSKRKMNKIPYTVHINSQMTILNSMKVSKNCGALSKIKFQNNQVTMVASYIPALFSKILFSKPPTGDFLKLSVEKLLCIH